MRPDFSRESHVDPGFSWDEVYEQLDWLPDGGLNVAHETIDRQAQGPRRDRIALVWIGRDSEREEHTFGELSRLTNRFANVLKSLGVDKGDRICINLGRLPEYYVAFVGTLKVGAVAVPLSSKTPPEAIKTRMLDTKAKVLVTAPETRRSLHAAVFEMFDLQHIVIVNKYGRDPLPLETADLDYDEEMSKAPDDFAVTTTGQYDHSTILYVETGPGALQGHLSIAQHLATARDVLGLDDGSTVWSMADPATAAGLSYGLFAPWAMGSKLVAYEDDVGDVACFAAVDRHRVSVLHAPSDAVGDFARTSKGVADDHDLSSLRHVVTDGGALAAEVVERTAGVLRVPVYDSWLQAESGTAVIANSLEIGVRPGSAGRAAAGVEIEVLGDDFRPVSAGSKGELALRPGWSSMFRGYWGDREAYSARFRRGWYVTGQRASIDNDGFVWLAE
jgi:acetyl-CoA synthetase